VWKRSNWTSFWPAPDIITLHTPLTDKTRNILSAESLAKTKKGVFIVNCARGGLVDEAALRAALESAMSAARRSTCLSRSRPSRTSCSARQFRRHPAPRRRHQ